MKKWLGLGLLSATLSVQAGMFDSDPLMKHTGREFKPIIKMLKGRRPMNLNEVRFHAENIAKLARQIQGHRWQDPDVVGLIRQNPNKYQKIEHDYIRLADQFVRVTQQARTPQDFVPALRNLARSCKACHKSYKP